MEVLLRPEPGKPRLSIVLVDWSVRESFHSLDYLAQQTVDRSQYEVLWVEYYGTRPAEIQRRVERAKAGGPRPLDAWIVLELPREIRYHKHLLYNAGLLASRGEYVVFCDSDAMYRPSFVASILAAFDEHPDRVIHLDQVRSQARRYYPFCHPTFEELHASGGCALVNGAPPGLAATRDRLHRANYGACMAAPRDALLKIGGADEHLDYLGHICGPYDMTFRLVNLGLAEHWHPSEWSYHTWHPGTDGPAEYHGPHDGRGVSATALRNRENGRVLPYSENEGIRALRLSGRAGSRIEDLSLAHVEHWHEQRTPVRLPPRRHPLRWALQHPALGPAWAGQTLLDLSAYGLLVARTVGAPADPGGEPKTPHEPLGVRVRVPLARLRDFAARTSRMAAVTADLLALHRELVARCRQKLAALASQDVEAIAILGDGAAARTLRAIAADHGIRVLVCSGDPGRLADAPDVPVIVSERHNVSAHVRELERAGIPARRIQPLDPLWIDPDRGHDSSTATAIGAIELSIVLPSRGRPQLAARLLDELHRTAAEPARIEVLLMLDDDDPDSHALDHPALRVRKRIGPRLSMGRLTNAAASQASGRAVFLLNDDVRVRTPGWDAEISRTLQSFPDGIACLYPNDLHQRRRNATFPILSRAALGAIGQVTEPGLHHYHIESHLMAIFRRLRRLGHDRLVYLEHVAFEHMGAPRPARIEQKGPDGHDDAALYASLRRERAHAARRLTAAILEGARAAQPALAGAPRLPSPR
jgi:hypothetical protein